MGLVISLLIRLYCQYRTATKLRATGLRALPFRSPAETDRGTAAARGTAFVRGRAAPCDRAGAAVVHVRARHQFHQPADG